MKWLFQSQNLIFFLLALYLSGGVLYPYNSIMRHGFQLMIIVVSFIYLFKTFSLKYNNKVYNSFTALLLLNIFGFIFTADYSSKNNVGLLTLILTNLLCFYPIYYYTVRGQFDKKKLTNFFFLILPIIIGKFYFDRNERMEEFNADNVVNNSAYLFVYLIPYALLLKKRLFSIVGIMVLMFFIIQGAKRGAILSGTVGLLYFFYLQFKTIDSKNRIKGYIVSILGISILAYFAYDFFISNEYLIMRLERIDFGTGDGSGGRNIIYAKIFDTWYNSDSFVHLLFGYGFAGSLKLTGGYFAHNDWLELLSNFGILGIVIYAVVFVSILRYVFKLKNQSEKIIVLCIVSIWFLTTLFSMNYPSPFSSIQSIILGYFIGLNNKQNFVGKNY